MGEKTTFALFFGNRGFFPASLQRAARRQLPAALRALGHGVLMMDARATPCGAVETAEQGRRYAAFLSAHRGEFGGVILCLPNFGDENGAVAALKDAGVPILVHAYPDELDRMAPELRRDAFCGKLSIMDVFRQNGISFTALKPHAVHPGSERFTANVDYFDRLCRVVDGLRGLIVGAVGARTTAFKTVRIDEITLQRHGVTVETFDLSDVFARVRALRPRDPKLRARTKELSELCSWRGVPRAAKDNLARLSLVLDELIEENGLDAVAVRCWTEMQSQLGISPCVLLGMLNDRGVVAACEVDVGSAVAMAALRSAAGAPSMCLDWNNNYGDEDDKCILFHCGSVPPSLMAARGWIAEHAILKNAVGEGRSYGCNQGRIPPMPMTFGNMLTEDGRVRFYLGRGRFTEDAVPEDYFGCAGVAEIPDLQGALQTIGYQGHRHHVAVAPGHVLEPTHEALAKYLGFDVTVV